MNRGELIDLLKTNSFWAKKSLGQNFLIDDEALQKIVEAADLKSDDVVVEVGPGLGILTAELITRAGEVVAIEKDEELAEFLNKNLKIKTDTQCHPGLDPGSKIVDSRLRGNDKQGRGNDKGETLLRDDELGELKIVQGDILSVNLPEIVGERKYKVVANIPYYITSKIIRLFLELTNKPETMVMLVQKEVAERICAKPGDMSVLALSVQYFGEPEIIGIVPKESFFPSPKVDSAILRIVISKSNDTVIASEEAKESQVIPVTKQSIRKIATSPTAPRNDKQAEKAFFRMVNIGFASKRKTLANNLSVGYKIDKMKATEIVQKIGLKTNVRAQELSVGQWRILVNQVESRK